MFQLYYFSAILDGIDLNIQKGPYYGYSAFIREFRKYERFLGKGKKYTISVTAQCHFPDPNLGPAPGTVLTDVPTRIDHVTVQYHTEDCQTNSMNQWFDYSKSISRGPNIYMGLPASEGASLSEKNYHSPEQLECLYQVDEFFILYLDCKGAWGSQGGLEIPLSRSFFAQITPRNCLKFMFTPSLPNHAGGLGWRPD